MSLESDLRSLELSAVRRVNPGARGLRALSESVSPGGLWVPREYANDLGGRVRAVFDGGVRRLLRPVGVGVLSAALLVSSCDTNGGVIPPPPDPDPVPNPDCVSGSAVDYAREVGLDVDVSVYDSNLNRHEYDAVGERCFTRFERSMIDELRSLVDEGADEIVLQRVVDDYPVVGPATVWALRGTWDATLADQAHNPALRFYDPDTNTDHLGWIDLAGGIGVSLPSTFLAEQNLDHLTPHPIDENVHSVSPPDWNRNPDETSTFLDRIPGCEGLLSTGEDFPTFVNSSGDYIFNGHLLHTPVPIRSVLPPGTVVAGVRVRDRVTWRGVEFTDGVVDLRYDVHPDDRYLIGFKAVYEMAAHVVPGPDNITTDTEYWLFDTDEFSVRPGSTADGVLAYVNPRMAAGASMVYDHTVFVRDEHPEISEVGPPWDEARTMQTLDYLAAFTIPESEVPRQVTAVPMQPRYADLTIHGCQYELEFE
ncbi:MAG: hypothetical protein ACMXYM_04735 [Candidatus Woesearchaeota archaeon]